MSDKSSRIEDLFEDMQYKYDIDFNEYYIQVIDIVGSCSECTSYISTQDAIGTCTKDPVYTAIVLKDDYCSDFDSRISD